jgi:predicted alpha/beta hydrolase family esterase
MTKQILFIQGGGAGAHDQWDNNLVASLSRELGPGFEIGYPLMPNETDPGYAAWKAAIVKEIAKLEADAILVGHSLGATILVNVIAESEPTRRFAGLFLIAAPFVGQGGWPSEDIAPMDDIGARLPTSLPIHLYHGRDDQTVPVAHVSLYAQAIPRAVIRRLKGRDHQLDNDLSEVAEDIQRLG